MPMAMFNVKGSWKKNVPMIIAVSGSSIPNIEVFVAPIAFVEAAMVIVATAVQNIAKPAMPIQHEGFGTACSGFPNKVLTNNIIEPNIKQ